MQSDTTPSDAYFPKHPFPSAKRSLKTLSHAEIVDLVESLGQPKFRAKQLEDWIWSKGATSFDQMSNLPKSLREELAKAVSFQSVTQVTRQLPKMAAVNISSNIRIMYVSNALACQREINLPFAHQHRQDALWDALFVPLEQPGSRGLSQHLKSTTRFFTSEMTLKCVFQALSLWDRENPS